MDILVTGATGNVGAAVIEALAGSGHRVFAGLRDPGRAVLPEGVAPVAVDFARGIAPGRGPGRGFDAVFLMRPPQIADPAPFRAFLAPLDRATRIVLLSVQGAERKSYLPHAKIEAVIEGMGFAHCFVRPGYFMENLTSTLAGALADSGQVVLPAGRLAFDWVSVRDVAGVVARALTDPGAPEAITVLSGERLGFGPALDAVNAGAGTGFGYAPMGLGRYVRHARRGGMGWTGIGVMLLLHWLPRFRPAPPRDNAAEVYLGRPPERLEGWAARNRARLHALEAGRV